MSTSMFLGDVADFSPRTAGVRDLVDAVRRVRDGEGSLSPGFAQRILEILCKPASGRIELLSPREREVLRALASGLGSKECAAHLDVSQSTVATYRARLMEKLGLRTTADIIRFAVENDVLGSP